MKKVFVLLVALSVAAMSMAQKKGAAVKGDLPSDGSYLNPIITAVPGLSIGPDAAAGGLADMGVATKGDINSQFWNSSKYALMKSQGGFTFNYSPWLTNLGVKDVHLITAAGYYNISQVAGAVSASLRYFTMGEVTLRESLDDIGYSVTPHEVSFDLGYSRILAENFSMGVVLRLIASDLSAKNDETYKTGYAFAADINGFYDLPIDNKRGTDYFRFGFNIQNLGTKISYDDGNIKNFLPLTLRLGVSYQVAIDEFNRISLHAETYRLMVPSRYSRYASTYDSNDDSETKRSWQMDQNEYNKLSVMQGLAYSWADAPYGAKEEIKEFNWGLGAEYSYNEQFFARVGYNNEAKIKGNRKYFTFGAGFQLSGFKLDVSYALAIAQNNPLNNTLRFSLGFDVDGLKRLADAGIDKKEAAKAQDAW